MTFFAKKVTSSRLHPAAIFLAYLALSYLHLAPGANWRHAVIGGGADAEQFVWFLNWWPFALSHQLNPFLCGLIWAPAGYNLAWATAVPFAALLALPITTTGGALLAYNLLTLMAAPAAAFSAYLLARALVRAWPAAFAGGYLFGFSPYTLGQTSGHMHLFLDFLVPLLAWLAVRRFQGVIGRRFFIIATSALLVAQIGLSIEILITANIFASLTWLIFRHQATPPHRAVLDAMAREHVAAGVAAIVLAAPFFYYLIAGLSQVPPVIALPSWYSTDLLNFFIPTQYTELGGRLALPISRHFTGNAGEQGGYLGLPLIAILAAYFRGVFHLAFGRALLLALLAAAIASLGPELQIEGHHSFIPLPWLAAAHLPILVDALPSRLSMYVDLAAGLAVALWLDGPGARRQAGRYAAALVACAFIYPASGFPGWGAWQANPLFTPGAIAAALGPGQNLLILPAIPDGPAVAWQYDSGMGFALATADLGFVPVREAGWRILPELAGPPGPDFAPGLAAFCDTHHVTTIAAGPGTPPAILAILTGLGWPSRTVSGVLLVTPPPSALLSYAYVLGDDWPGPNGSSWMGARVEILTHNRPTLLTLSGADRPAGVAETITLTTGGRAASYAFTPATTRSFALPASADITITAQSVFRPHDYFASADRRHLSVMLNLK